MSGEPAAIRDRDGTPSLLELRPNTEGVWFAVSEILIYRK